MVDTEANTQVTQGGEADRPYLAGMLSLSGVINGSLKEITIRDSDQGLAALILSYAAEIDKDRKQLKVLGPLLLQAMESLQMSPKARALAAKGGKESGKPASSPLDELRKRREARKNGTQAVDTATS